MSYSLTDMLTNMTISQTVFFSLLEQPQPFPDQMYKEFSTSYLGGQVGELQSHILVYIIFLYFSLSPPPFLSISVLFLLAVLKEASCLHRFSYEAIFAQTDLDSKGLSTCQLIAEGNYFFVVCYSYATILKKSFLGVYPLLKIGFTFGQIHLGLLLSLR